MIKERGGTAIYDTSEWSVSVCETNRETKRFLRG